MLRHLWATVLWWPNTVWGGITVCHYLTSLTPALVSLGAVLCLVTQRSSPRDETQNCCEGDYHPLPSPPASLSAILQIQRDENEISTRVERTKERTTEQCSQLWKTVDNAGSGSSQNRDFERCRSTVPFPSTDLTPGSVSSVGFKEIPCCYSHSLLPELSTNWIFHKNIPTV